MTNLTEEGMTMQAIEVTAHFDENGKVTPMRFTWRGSVYLVESVGRHWNLEETLHILVMVPGGRIFELVFVGKEARWYLGGVQPDRMAA